MEIYLDYAATTPLDKEVLEKMLPYLTDTFGNPDSLHSVGRKAAYAVTCARDRIARTVGVSPTEVYFTSGGTEADNWAVRGLMAEGKHGIVISAIEHHAVLAAGERAQAGGMSVVYAQPDSSGMVTAEKVEQAMTADTGLVCVMAVNNETGVIQPIEEIAALCKRRGCLLFCDCVQAACTQDLKKILSVCDAASVSAHKLYGPKGVGALIVKRRTPLSALISGGEQERGLRGGTLNVAGIVGLSYALERVQAEREAFCRRVSGLRDLFEHEVLSALESRVRADGTDCRVPSVSHLTFYGAGSEMLLNRLDLAGVCVSGGAACAAHSAKPSHVMLAMGRTQKEAKSGIRFSFGKDTTEAETRCAAETVIGIAKEIL